MNMNISMFTGLLILLLSVGLNGQDLIERTRVNARLDSESTPNTIAEAIQVEKNSNTFSTVSLFHTNQKRHIEEYDDYLYDAVFLELDDKKLQSVFKANPASMTLDVPVTEKRSFALELMKVEVLTPDFKIHTSDGRALYYEDIPVAFYRGIIKGDLNSTATITVFEDKIKGLITDKDGNYVLAQISDKQGEYTLYNDQNLVAENTSQCGTDEDLMTLGENAEASSESANRFNNCIEVYIECDRATYQANGSDLMDVQEFVSDLFAEVTTIYANENINIGLSEVFVWTTPDPYRLLSSTSAILETFGNTRRNDYTGRLAHLISTRNLGGGIAWLNVLCSNYFSFNADWNGDGVAELHHAGPYAVSGSLSTNVVPVPTYSWNVNVFAHEMGHNLGSPHTQKCTWGPNGNSALDNCFPTEGACGPGPAPSNGGTVMSYCHMTPSGINFNNGFGDEPGDLIRNNYNGASCDLTCENLVLPIELLSFTATASDKKIAILEWSTATEINSSHFEIERKIVGKDWEVIGKVEAADITNTTQFYQLEDERPANGENLYRLKQVDLNGDFAYSSIETLTFKGQHHIIYNNPVNDVLNLRIQSEQQQALRIALYDSQGRMIEERAVEVQAGFQILDWNMSNLPKGIYFMQVADDVQTMFKLVKM